MTVLNYYNIIAIHVLLAWSGGTHMQHRIHGNTVKMAHPAATRHCEQLPETN